MIVCYWINNNITFDFFYYTYFKFNLKYNIFVGKININYVHNILINVINIIKNVVIIINLLWWWHSEEKIINKNWMNKIKI